MTASVFAGVGFRLEEDGLVLRFLLDVGRKSLEELWCLPLANDLNNGGWNPSPRIHCSTTTTTTT